MINFLSRLFRRKHAQSTANGIQLYCWCGQRLYMMHNGHYDERLSCLVSERLDADHKEIGQSVDY